MWFNSMFKETKLRPLRDYSRQEQSILTFILQFLHSGHLYSYFLCCLGFANHGNHAFYVGASNLHKKGVYNCSNIAIVTLMRDGSSIVVDIATFVFTKFYYRLDLLR